jgi:putative sterol carrier protein
MAYTNVKETFEKMPSVFDATKAEGINDGIQYHIEGEGGGNWFIELKDGTCRVEEGTYESPKVTITMSGGTWLALINREMSGMQAAMSGKLKVQGDLMLAQKIDGIFAL